MDACNWVVRFADMEQVQVEARDWVEAMHRAIKDTGKIGVGVSRVRKGKLK